MKFVADDGKIFDTMEECEEYESRSERNDIAQLWHKYVITYDQQGTITEPDSDVENTQNFLREVNDIIDSDDCTFICIEDACLEWNKIYDYFYIEYGSILPKSQGTWRYDWENDKWCSFEEELEKLRNHWNPITSVRH